MLGPQDLSRLAQVIEPGQESILAQQPEDYDIEHLDYAYVKDCQDTAELQVLLKVLKYSLLI